MRFSKAVLAAREYHDFLAREAEAEAIAERVRSGAIDYDPVRERHGLVSFGGDPPVWSVVAGGGAMRRQALLDLGVLYFGAPPWRRSCLVSVNGRLGELERVVAAMAPPDADFAFTFPFDCDDALRRSSAVTRSGELGAKRVGERARWRRAQSGVQGVLL